LENVERKGNIVETRQTKAVNFNNTAEKTEREKKQAEKERDWRKRTGVSS